MSTSTVDLESRLAFSAAKDICRAHAKSFYFASYFLPRHKRDAAYAVYAFCRMMDDAIDVPAGQFAGGRIAREHPVVSLKVLDSRRQDDDCEGGDSLALRLSLLQDRLDEIYDNRLELPAVTSRSPQQHALWAFAQVVHHYEISKQYFVDLAEGCRMDLVFNRYPDWPALQSYCYHVAGVVGLIMSCIFGLTHSDAKKPAIAMGTAMQLTNILRDVKEDFDRDRIYLPQDEMARFGYSESDLAAHQVNEAFVELMQFQIARARRLYREGAEGLCWLAGDGSRLTASTMAVIYSGILDAIERQKFDVFSKRAHLSTAEKFRRLPRAWTLARRLSDQPMPRMF